MHRSPIGTDYKAVAEDRLRWFARGHHRGHGEERVEPVTKLAGEALRDEVGGEPSLPVLRILAVAHRGEGDDPRVKPRIPYVRNTRHLRPASAAVDLYFVNVWTVCRMPLKRGCPGSCATLEILARAKHLNLAARGAFVDRKGETPIALLGDHPVAHVT